MKLFSNVAALLKGWDGQKAQGTGRRLKSPLSSPFERVTHPWDWHQRLEGCANTCFCNICWWSGGSFRGYNHSESAVCPDCGSIARDRFLFFCFVGRQAASRYRVLETSPRLGKDYRRAMRRWFDYRASDFDQRAHRADLAIDLQDIELDSASVDILLTPHVLEHVPDTDRALDEIYRILSPQGAMYLQVPILQGTTARPTVPEFHGDHTPVEWRFGPDLTQLLREHGFHTRLLCTVDLHRHLQAGSRPWPHPTSPEFDVASILESLCYADLMPVANAETATRIGFQPAYMFLTWECRKVAQTQRAQEDREKSLRGDQSRDPTALHGRADDRGTHPR